MDNKLADEVIEMFESLKDLKNQGKIKDADISWDEEKNCINIKHVAHWDVKTIQSVLNLKILSAEIVTKNT